MINNSFIKVTYLNGEIQFIGQVWGDCGSYNGTATEYYRNGNVKVIRKYQIKNGKGCPVKNGIWTYYKKDGSISKMVEFEYGIKKINSLL